MVTDRGSGVGDRNLAVSLSRPRDPQTIWLVVALLVAAAGLRLWRVDQPPAQYFDEIYYARTAQEYLTGAPIYEWTHPPLSKLLIAAGVRVFGLTPRGWRVAPALFGVLLIAALYLLGCWVFDNPRKGVLLAFVGTIEPFFLVESRIAKPEIFLVGFAVAAYAFWWAALRSGRLRWLYLAGLCAGGAAATKWTGAATTAVLVFATILAWRRGAMRVRPGHAAAALLLLPLVVYAASYAPHLARGETLGDVLRLHRNMYGYHSTLQATHPYTSAWWTWPLLLRPMWYHYEATGGTMTGVFAVGNPLLWWAAIPAIALVAWRGWTHRRLEDVFVAAGFGLTYLPYAVIGRLLFVYHMLPALPFAYLALLSLADAAAARTGLRWVTAYLVVAALVFVYYLPVLTAYPVPAHWLRWWIWIRSWV
ncbi:MAG: phospholipid carrier-dependent glycosyltransferase [Armatimonadota bacterium]|nr:phospholipid carrier-dependent glycosyltransferase [Armatimonadota bacterium]MDR5697345.1 phospholipid carrier-dependent glycosyltransferase [Armatimonadota bacterium]